MRVMMRSCCPRKAPPERLWIRELIPKGPTSIRLVGTPTISHSRSGVAQSVPFAALLVIPRGQVHSLRSRT